MAFLNTFHPPTSISPDSNYQDNMANQNSRQFTMEYLPGYSSGLNRDSEKTHGVNSPSKPVRRGAVDFTGMGGVRSDHWHRGKQLETVSRNSSQYPGIHFFPSDGVGSGVALTECEYTEGIAMAGKSAMECLPREFQGIQTGFLIITWPGYQHLKWKQKLTFVQPSGLPYTVGHMASQVAYLWRKFYQSHYEDFKGHGLRLSPTDISFNHLRLHQIYSYDGRTWQAEVSYVSPP